MSAFAIDLADLEASRTEVEEAVITMLKTVVTHSQTHNELMPAILNLAATLTTIDRAIVCDGEAKPERKGANDG